MTSSLETEQSDPPECPICLQPYDNDDIIPRVLPCGHSSCELCLTILPRPSSLPPGVIRCPSCTQLVKLPHPQGPTALPKNIDLLRFCPSSKPHIKKTLIASPSQRRRFPIEVFSPEVYAVWKDWVLPSGVVVVEKEGSGLGRIRVSELGFCGFVKCRLVDDQRVGLVEMGRFEVGEEEHPLFEYSYVSKVIRVLGCMSDFKRTELGFLLGVSLRQVRVCKLLGLWLDVESGCLYLVTERKLNEISTLGGLRDVFGQENECLGVIGSELSEALTGLLSEGFVCGCLSLSCIHLDEFGHVYVDLGEVLVVGRKIRECVFEGLSSRRRMYVPDYVEFVSHLSNMDVFISPEVLLELLGRDGVEMESNDQNIKIDYRSEVWLFASVLLRLVTGEQFNEGMYNYVRTVLEAKREQVSDWKIVYMQWVETLNATMETVNGNSVYSPLKELLLKCMDLDPSNRPLITDVWKNIRGCSANYCNIHLDTLEKLSMKESSIQILVLGQLSNVSNDLRKEPTILGSERGHEDCETASSQVGEMRVDDVIEGITVGKLRCKDLQGHVDCVTSLCVGGGFLFSSSFDKTINVWSLQDFRRVHTFRGHEHKVMAMVFLDQEKPLCISADNGGGIFSWEVVAPFSQEPLKKWYEEKDWRYSGINALAISESGCLYTGSGDRLIKAWSLNDYSLLCSMEGHKSVVSTLVLYNGVLYSGSWDGTVRLWCLHDHSPLAVFGEGMHGMVSSVLSLHADQDKVIAGHENGCVKIWVNGELNASIQAHNGAVFALSKEGKWVFTGGWDKCVKVQEISGEGMEMESREVGSLACDSVITALLNEGGLLFVGLANKLIKVYHC